METSTDAVSRAQPVQATPGLLPAPAVGAAPSPGAGPGLAGGGPVSLGRKEDPSWGGRGEHCADFLFKAVLSWPALTLFYFHYLEALLVFFLIVEVTCIH